MTGGVGRCNINGTTYSLGFDLPRSHNAAEGGQARSQNGWEAGNKPGGDRSKLGRLE
jgi:hypothetical protein